MALDMKKIISDGFLKIVENKPLNDITIQDMLDETKVSRQTFYNHFVDKNDLIQYIYKHVIIKDFNSETEMKDFYNSLLKSFKQMKKYAKFMKEACLMDGQNCLRNYIFKHCEVYDLDYHQKCYGEKKMPDSLYFATIYHSHASSSMCLSWILSDMPTSCEDLAKLVTQMRSIGMDELFKDGNKHPYK